MGCLGNSSITRPGSDDCGIWITDWKFEKVVGGMRIARSFFQEDPVTCARALVGCRLNWGPCAGMVVETEAYEAEGDAACHTAFRPGARAFVQDHPAGTAYVYLNYGIHWMLNVLLKGERDGFVLIRALEPLTGSAVMRAARGVENERQLCSGPGKLAQALGVIGAHHGFDLCADPEFGFALAAAPGPVVATPRIGIVRAVERPWRFHLAGNPHVSGSRIQNQTGTKKKTGRE